MSLEKYLDSFPQIAEQVYLHASAQIIGDVTIGAESSIWCHAVLRGDVNRIVVGRSSNIQDLTMCHVAHKTPEQPEGAPLIIGDFVTIGHGCLLHGCIIGNQCLVGMGTTVMDHAVVPDRVMIGAGSLISPGKILESGYLYVGRPVKKIRPLTLEEIDYLRYSAEHYVRVKNNYMRTIT